MTRELGEAFAIIDEVIALGPEHVEVPNIAVLGNQSVGKSSLLSLLINVNLFCEDGLATSGPTQIHSRTREAPYSARIQVEYHDVPDGSDPRFDFGTVDHPRELVDALQRAGNEARRIGSRACRVRTLDESREMFADPEDIDAGTPEHTSNVVVLHVSGPEQPNLSIIDLPGLVTKPNGREITEAAAKKYIRRPNTLVLLCLAAGGQDPSEGPEVRIVADADPPGERTIGIVTKADQISSNKNSHFRLIQGGGYDSFEFTPRAGWWPFRGRTRREKHLSAEAFAAVQDKVFEEDHFRALGRDVSWRALRNTIMSRSSDLVCATVPRLRALAASHLVAAQKSLEELPPEIADAPGALFALIDKVQEDVRDHYCDNFFGSRELEREVNQLARDLATGVAFVPVFKADWEAMWDGAQGRETTADTGEDVFREGNTCKHLPPRHGFTVTKRLNAPRDPSGGGAETGSLFLDQLHPLLMTCCNITVSSPDLPKAGWYLLTDAVLKWTAPCMAFEERVWEGVDAAVVRLVAAACKKSNAPEAVEPILAAMRDGSKKYRENGKRFIREMLERATENPKYVGSRTFLDSDTHSAFALSRDFFDATYSSDNGNNGSSGSTLGSTPGGLPTPIPSPTRRRSSVLVEGPGCHRAHDDRSALLSKYRLDWGPGIPDAEDTPPGEWPEAYVRDINLLGVRLVQLLEERGDSLVETLGRWVKGEVVNYVENVSAILRSGLGLTLSPEAIAIAKRLTVADAATVRRREDAKRRLEKAENLDYIFKRPRVME